MRFLLLKFCKEKKISFFPKWIVINQNPFENLRFEIFSQSKLIRRYQACKFDDAFHRLPPPPLSKGVRCTRWRLNGVPPPRITITARSLARNKYHRFVPSWKIQEDTRCRPSFASPWPRPATKCAASLHASPPPSLSLCVYGLLRAVHTAANRYRINLIPFPIPSGYKMTREWQLRPWATYSIGKPYQDNFI